MKSETCTSVEYIVVVKLKLVSEKEISIWFLHFVYRTIFEGYLSFFMTVISGPSESAGLL
jgi:hypothetical protein